MRADGWMALLDGLGRLVDMHRDHAQWAEVEARVREVAASLAPIESYWAFPGGRVFTELQTWIERAEFARAHQSVRRIHRMLAAQTYRHESSGGGMDANGPSQIESDHERAAQLSRPYFEVLIVDEMSASEEDALRRRVQRKRNVDDDFVFDVVVVPSFEDALIATLVNFNLQAVVVRHGFPFRSVYNSDKLRRMLEGVGANVENMSESERGLLLGQKIAQLRPELDL